MLTDEEIEALKMFKDLTQEQRETILEFMRSVVRHKELTISK